MLPKNTFKRVLKIYGVSILLFTLLLEIVLITYVKINLGDDPAFPKAVILVLIGGFFYAAFYAVFNLTQFLVVRFPQLHLLAYFFPLVLSLGTLLYDVMHDASEIVRSILFFAVQLCVTIIIYVWYQRIIPLRSK
ncbi:hypothetical protein [Kordia sp.]|uniref:hypothetical protein n=1 Tax=Kordia sp. TaxID=1965332 RepID=UPI003B5CA655